MGVVYKARDTNLDRTVALKMVLGGKFATADEIQRFRIEGEAAARLDHPGIVPIYDIGEADGNHFFSMKFIDGAALVDRLEDYQSNNRKSAELLIKIARAVQHAHQRGVLHRDLKPANVLIDPDGDPLVTDLGLAKRMDGDSELTQTGLIMGTPGFMAPEQAAGQKDVTTAADVFSLGAILFWLNTGEAPFKGETAVQTVMQTIEDETPSMRARVKDADSDLDLICQKAMHKDPLKRYSSSAALADDLQAWLDGELLSVRAPTALSLASLWLRKNLRTVIGASIAGAVCGIAVGLIVLFSQMQGVAEQEYRIQQLGGSSQTWVAPLVGLRNMSEEWGAMEFLRVPIVAISALICVLVVRPETREANILAGITAGLFAGIFAYMSGCAWPALNAHAVRSGEHDVKLLATAVWLDSDQERSIYERALMYRYPGLEQMDSAHRRKRIYEKIMHDQNTSLMRATWFSAVISMLFAGLPLAVACVLSGTLWQRGLRGWHWLGLTWEQGAYVLLASLALSFWFFPLRPAAHVLLISLAAFLFMLYLAATDKSLWLRALAMPASFFVMFWLAGDGQATANCTLLVGHSKNDEEIRESLVRCDRYLSLMEAGWARYQTGIARLYLGDLDEYQTHCRKAIENFAGEYDPGNGSRIAKLCMLRPDLQDPKSFALLYEFSETASSFESADDYRWYCSTRALVELRRGNPADAIEWNNKCRNGEGEGAVANGYRHAQSRAIDALAFLDLGQPESARKSLAMGQGENATRRKHAMKDGLDDSWVDWLVFQILEREVVEKLGSEQP